MITPSLTVVRVQAIISHVTSGLVLGEVLFSDGVVARFRVKSRAPSAGCRPASARMAGP
jgi:hypothetical protein